MSSRHLPAVTPSTAAAIMDLVAYARTAAPTAPLEWLHGFVAARVVEPVSAAAERPDTIRTASGQGRSIVAGCALTA